MKHSNQSRSSDRRNRANSPPPQFFLPGRTLCVMFAIALMMGAGPGVHLVNGRGPILGMPAVYAWAVLWYAVEATIVVIAFKTVWRK